MVRLEPCALTFDDLKARPGGRPLPEEKDYTLREAPSPPRRGRSRSYSRAFADAGHDPLPTYLEPSKKEPGAPLGGAGREVPPCPRDGHPGLLLQRGPCSTTSGPSRSWSPAPRRGWNKTADVQRRQRRRRHRTDRGFVKMKASVDERVMEGVVLVPHGWPEGELQQAHRLQRPGARRRTPPSGRDFCARHGRRDRGRSRTAEGCHRHLPRRDPRKINLKAGFTSRPFYCPGSCRAAVAGPCFRG